MSIVISFFQPFMVECLIGSAEQKKYNLMYDLEDDALHARWTPWPYIHLT